MSKVRPAQLALKPESLAVSAAALGLRAKYCFSPRIREPEFFESEVRVAENEADPDLWAPVEPDDPRTPADLEDFAARRFQPHRPAVFEAHRVHAWASKWVMGDLCGHVLRAASATEMQRAIASYYARLFKANVGRAFRAGASRRGLVSPRAAVVAEAVGCSPVTVRKWLRTMTEKGLLVTKRGGRGEGLLVVAVDPGTALLFAVARPLEQGSRSRSVFESDPPSIFAEKTDAESVPSEAALHVRARLDLSPAEAAAAGVHGHRGRNVDRLVRSSPDSNAAGRRPPDLRDYADGVGEVAGLRAEAWAAMVTMETGEPANDG